MIILEVSLKDKVVGLFTIVLYVEYCRDISSNWEETFLKRKFDRKYIVYDDSKNNCIESENVGTINCSHGSNDNAKNCGDTNRSDNNSRIIIHSITSTHFS